MSQKSQNKLINYHKLLKFFSIYSFLQKYILYTCAKKMSISLIWIDRSTHVDFAFRFYFLPFSFTQRMPQYCTLTGCWRASLYRFTHNFYLYWCTWVIMPLQFYTKYLSVLVQIMSPWVNMPLRVHTKFSSVFVQIMRPWVNMPLQVHTKFSSVLVQIRNESMSLGWISCWLSITLRSSSLFRELIFLNAACSSNNQKQSH